MEVLLEHCRQGNLDALRAFAPVKDYVNARSTVDGATLLTTACERGHADVVDYLLLNDADPNLLSGGAGSQSALHLACANRHSDCVRRLLRAPGTDVNAKDCYNLTPLIRAAEVGSLELVRSLVGAGAQVNLMETRVNHNTPLHVACFSGHTDVVEYLVSRGADVNATNGNGNTALMLTIQHGFHGLAAGLVERAGALVNVINRSYLHRTPLHLACDARQVRLVDTLVTHGAVLDAQDQAGNTSLMLSVRNNDIDTVKYLLQKGADVNMQNINKQTALMMACTKGYVVLIKLLISYDADVNKADNKGHTCLTTMFFYYKNKAWTKGNEGSDNVQELLSTFDTLLRNNAHVDIKDNKGIAFLDYIKQGNFVGCWSPRTLKFSKMKEEESYICDQMLQCRLPLSLACQSAGVLCQHTDCIYKHKCPKPLMEFIKMHDPTKLDI